MYLIPEPKQVKNGEGSFFLDYKTEIVLDKNVEDGLVTAKILKDCIKKWAGLEPRIIKGSVGEGDITLRMNGELSAQEYRLLIDQDGIFVEGGNGAGLLYGTETLCQIVEQCGSCLGCVEITDWPDLLHRGYYLDETRGRVLKLEALKQIVDRLCRYKINEFQLYIEHTYMFHGLSEMWRDETPLTAEDILELDRYCRERHVELIPSMASFGHLYMLLSTKTYGDLCELPDAEKQPFSFRDRMTHHTVNVSDDRVLPLIKRMLEEYMALFSSDKFNLCADETFDLGKGKSRVMAEEKGVHRIYIDYVKELCRFLVERGKQPMFWGDVICGEPFLVQELPENIICLNWGYAPEQAEEPTQKMAETGVKQYLCPGVAGWNQWMNLLENSYRNIVRMCSFAKKYQAIGILNTDWGDFGHINHPRFSVPGMIYGAAFSWNGKVIPFEEMNRQIARVEYHDRSMQLVNLLARLPEHVCFQWEHAVVFQEGGDFTALEGTLQANAALEEVRQQLKKSSADWEDCRDMLLFYDVTIDGIEIWNEIGGYLQERDACRVDVQEEKGTGERDTSPDCGFALAERLECWFMAYKELWRKDSREGELHRIAEVVFWYADLLRGKGGIKNADWRH